MSRIARHGKITAVNATRKGGRDLLSRLHLPCKPSVFMKRSLLGNMRFMVRVGSLPAQGFVYVFNVMDVFHVSSHVAAAGLHAVIGMLAGFLGSL